MGDINLSDVERAGTAGDAIVLGFNVNMGEICAVCLLLMPSVRTVRVESDDPEVYFFLEALSFSSVRVRSLLSFTIYFQRSSNNSRQLN